MCGLEFQTMANNNMEKFGREMDESKWANRVSPL